MEKFVTVTHNEEKKVIEYKFGGVCDIMAVVDEKKWPQFLIDCGASQKARDEFDKETSGALGDCWGRNRWNNYHTVEMVKDELRAPTPNMAGVIKTSGALFNAENFTIEKPRRKIRRRLEDGDEIDIDRWREREPDMWEQSVKVRGERFGVRIGVNIATPAKTKEDGFKWRTSAVMAILHICEEHCIPCEVMAYECTAGGCKNNKTGQWYNTRVSFPLKRPEHLMDIDTLGYCLGNLSFFRNAVLGARGVATALYELGSKSEGLEWKNDWGMGRPRDMPNSDENEFRLSAYCFKRDVAEAEVQRFIRFIGKAEQKSEE